MDQVDCVVVGAGVVGLAIGRALAQAGREVIILEAAEAIGTGISSRNSEVIHAGIYYPKDSLMARFCVAGKRALYQFCADHGVPHKNCGKLIVATNGAEAGKLASIEARARANGVEDLRFLTAVEAQALEPALACNGALLSPSTGIVDSHHLMLALLGMRRRSARALASTRRSSAGARDSRGSSAPPSRCASCRRGKISPRPNPGRRRFQHARQSRRCRRALSPSSMRWVLPLPAFSATFFARE